MSTPYCYEYPRPAVTTDVALFSRKADQWYLLLIRRAHAPYAGDWALPGGFLEMDEDIAQCAQRELTEETGLTNITLNQLGCFGQPDRDPRGRVISVAYYGIIESETPPHPQAASDAAEAAWFPLKALPSLAFDHAQIIQQAQAKLREDPQT